MEYCTATKRFPVDCWMTLDSLHDDVFRTIYGFNISLFAYKYFDFIKTQVLIELKKSGP